MPKIKHSLGIIPARYASTRFPGKPLADIGGKTMIQRVVGQALQSSVETVVVATDDARIFDHVLAFGGLAVMTSAAHPSGTDRCAEVIQMPQFSDFQIIVNIQGDEPFIEPSQIDLALHFLNEKKECTIATLAVANQSADDYVNPHIVKVVMDNRQRALYFSRSPLPFFRNPAMMANEKPFFYRHSGLYAFRREALLLVAAQPPGLLEMAESLEQLRWLEMGLNIGVALAEKAAYGIDTPEDLKRLKNIGTP